MSEKIKRVRILGMRPGENEAAQNEETARPAQGLSQGPGNPIGAMISQNGNGRASAQGLEPGTKSSRAGTFMISDASFLDFRWSS
ncbi:hypothetical protein IVA88_14955 [Bradyrhizobium sp. 149]|uniref:hypothetical protein n=1 Tax=Bradyrhizobium sp. 149 TaxID=2782624 RepID=UPI001FF9D0BF|nr:hypothetical protein [Bradyrhizobium sp. 149]MCK1652728.1 hypothetical protein [Bradyrhizobium sp. 149]